MAEQADIVIPGDLGPDAAQAWHARLLDRIAADAAALTVDLDAPQGTAIALQLAAACGKSLHRDGRLAGFGPNCGLSLAPPGDTPLESKVRG